VEEALEADDAEEVEEVEEAAVSVQMLSTVTNSPMILTLNCFRYVRVIEVLLLKWLWFSE